MKQQWKVDMNRLIELVASRMYSDPIKAGIRELITNSLDARMGETVEIWLDYDDIQNSLRYTDNGVGISPEAFKEIYGKIASGHKRKKGTRGFFGIGRMSLIAASEKGLIMSYKDGKVYTWKFNKEGWEGPEVEEDLDEIGHGVFIQFEGLHLGDLREIELWIQNTFSVPLALKECTINFQHNEVFTQITGPDWILWEDFTKTKRGDVHFYSKEETDGTLYICQKGILVREEPYTGLSAYIDQNFLDIKTDREGFINNEKYRYFRQVMKKRLAKLRPKKSFEKMEVDFIRRLMKEFKRYWFTKAKKVEPVLEKIELEFPETGKEIVTEEPVIEKVLPKGIPDHKVPNIDDPGMEEVKKEIEMWDRIPDPLLPEAPIIPKPGEEKEEDIEGNRAGFSRAAEVEDEKKKKEKTVVIRGAKPVAMGEDYPMVFYETEPFVLIFNTSHPVFKRLVEKGKLGSGQLAVLFERMFECAYSDVHEESQEDLKKRWKEVDKKLKEIFK